MKRMLGSFALVIISAVSLSAQSAMKPSESPKATVDDFLAAVMQGGLQTANGWEQANGFFAHRNSVPDGKLMTVIGADYSTQLAWVRGNHAEVVVTYRELGQIDSFLRYQLMASTRRIIARYELIRMGSGTASAAQGTSPRQWRLQNIQRAFWTGLPGAVRYVSEAKANANSPLIKKNADITLSRKRRLRAVLSDAVD